MKITDIMLLDFILLLFPFLIYLIVRTYLKMNEKDQNDLLILTIFSAFYLINKIGITELNNVSILFLDLLVVFSYFYNHKNTALILSILLIFYYSSFSINIYILLIEYLLYFVMNFLIKKKYILINTIFIIKTIFITIYKKQFILYALLYIFIGNIFIYLYDFLKQFFNYHMQVKDITKEEDIYKSLFKITHEIKNPIAVLKGYLDMFDINDIDHFKKYIPILKSEIDRLIILLNDFLSISKLKIEKEEMDLVMLIEEVKDCLRPIMISKNISINLNIKEDEIYMIADYNRLKQTIINILKNSYEAIEKKGNINITIKKEKSKIKIIIEDNGIGMTKEELKKLKEAFFTTKQSGTGLGIYLSNEIIKKHNGTLNYDSNKGIGTVATIIIPKK